MKLFLKGERCYTDRCSFERRGYPPGVHGQGRRKLSEYGIQLREKQKIKRVYGLMEKQFHLTFERAVRMKGITGTTLIQLLESRLDSVVYRLGFSTTRAQARQLVRHGHIRVGNRRVDIPSYRVPVGADVSVREKSRKMVTISEALEAAQRRPMPSWLTLDRETFTGRMETLPVREEITTPMEEQLVVELYSR